MLDISHLPHLHMIAISGGTFTQGSRLVSLSDFELGQYPVTQALWEAVMGEESKPSRFEGSGRPVEQVSWFDAVAFCNRLNASLGQGFCYFSDKKHSVPYALAGELPNQGPVYYRPTGGAFRLPTEAGWEYAARGGKYQLATEYAGSDRAGDLAWYGRNSGKETQPVGLLQPNPLGLYDMSGNVLEWCWDEYSADEPAWQTNPIGPDESVVARGGSWNDSVTVSIRYYCDSDNRYHFSGFRLARHLTL